jgi:hypothetical protein
VGRRKNNRNRVVDPNAALRATLPDLELNISKLTRQHVEAVVKEIGPEHAYLRLGISRSTLYEWRKKWRAEDRARAREREECMEYKEKVEGEGR